MSRQFPTKPFYIHARSYPDRVAFPHGIGQILSIRPRTGAVEELWYALPDPRGGYLVINLADHARNGERVRLCISSSNVRTAVGFEHRVAVGAAVDPTDRLQLLAIEEGDEPWPWAVIRTTAATLDFDPAWGCLNLLLGRTDELIFFHRSGDDDSRWNLVEEDGMLERTAIEYDLARAVTDLNVQPEYYSEKVIRNDTDTSQTGSEVFSWTSSRSWSFTNSTETSAASVMEEKFTVTGEIKQIVTVSAEGTYSVTDTNTTSRSDGTEAVNSVSVSEQLDFAVPPHKRYKYRMKVMKGRVTVPYTMTLIYLSKIAGMAPRIFHIPGVFVGVNVIDSSIEMSDVTPL